MPLYFLLQLVQNRLYRVIQHLLFTYFNRKHRLHVNPQGIEILKLIVEKNEKLPTTAIIISW
jgi:hypothetical protein